MTENDNVESAAQTTDDAYMGADELRAHLQDRSAELVGTDDLQQANRRFEMLHEWRCEDDC